MKKNNLDHTLPTNTSAKQNETKFIPMPSMSMLPERDADKGPVLEEEKTAVYSLTKQP